MAMAAGVAAAFVAMSGTANAAGLQFTIDPQVLAALNPLCTTTTCYPTTQDGTEYKGGYDEQITITGPNTFTTKAFMNFSELWLGGTKLDNPTETGIDQKDGYGLYATFDATGTFSVTGTKITFNAISGSATLFVDPRNTVTKFSVANDATFGNYQGTTGADDKVLADATLIFGNGSEDPSLNPPQQGSFGLIFDPTVLTTLGMQYFINPIPFYIVTDLNGVFDPFNIPAPGQSVTVGGAGDMFFSNEVVPEPASLTLLGLGLVGLVRRRRSKS